MATIKIRFDNVDNSKVREFKLVDIDQKNVHKAYLDPHAWSVSDANGNVPGRGIFDINNLGIIEMYFFFDDEFCNWIESWYEISPYCEVMLDTVMDENDEEYNNYIQAYMQWHQIEMTLIDEHGPAGGNPIYGYRGERSDLEAMIHDLYDDDDLFWMITNA